MEFLHLLILWMFYQKTTGAKFFVRFSQVSALEHFYCATITTAYTDVHLQNVNPYVTFINRVLVVKFSYDIIIYAYAYTFF